MRRFWLMLLIGLLLTLVSAVPAQAETTEVTVVLNGSVVAAASPAVLVDGRTLVPLDWIPSLLGVQPRVIVGKWVTVGSFMWEIGSPEVRVARSGGMDRPRPFTSPGHGS